MTKTRNAVLAAIIATAFVGTSLTTESRFEARRVLRALNGPIT